MAEQVAGPPEIIELDTDKLLGFRQLDVPQEGTVALAEVLDATHNKVGFPELPPLT